MKWYNDITKYYLYRAFNKRLAMPVWVVFMIDQGLSVQQIALISAASAVIGFALEIPSGTISDEIGHKRALALAGVGQAAGIFLFSGGTFSWILAGSLTYWGFGTLMSGTHEAYFYERLVALKRSRDFQKLSGRARSFSSAFSMFAVATAGFLYLFSPELPFIISAGIYMLGVIVTLTFHPNPKQDVSVARNEGFRALFRHFSAAWLTVKKETTLYWIILLNGLILGATFATTEFQQVILENIGLAVVLFGIISMFKRFTAMVISPFMYRLSKHLQLVQILSVMTVLIGGYSILLGLVTSHILIFLVVILPTFIYVMNDVIIKDYQNHLTPSGSRATTLSIANLIESVVKLTIIGFIGIATTIISVEHTHIFIGLVLIVSMFVLIAKQQRHLRPNIKHNHA